MYKSVCYRNIYFLIHNCFFGPKKGLRAYSLGGPLQMYRLHKYPKVAMLRKETFIAECDNHIDANKYLNIFVLKI